MSDRRTQQRAISALIGSDAQKRAYTQLGLSKDWIDPIFGLTDFERLAIWIYTTPNNWHRIVNEALWRESAPRDVKVFASILNSAIRKLPRVRGIVFRGFTFKVEVAEFLETHGTGQVLVWPGFTSATRSRTRALIGNALFQIESKQGIRCRDMAPTKRKKRSYSKPRRSSEFMISRGVEMASLLPI